MPQFLKDRLRDAAIILAFATGLTFFGVYSTDAPNWATFLMWVVTCIAGGLASRFVVPLVFEQHIAGQLIAVQILVAAALIAFPVLLVFYLFSGAFGIWIPAELLPTQYLYVYAVCLAMTVLGVLIDRAIHKPADAVPDGTNPTARFLDRLPVKYRTASLWAVSSEDHYLRVHTSMGEELILMRLVDAVRELRRQRRADPSLLVGGERRRRRHPPRQWQAGSHPQEWKRGAGLTHLSGRRQGRGPHLRLTGPGP
ncbi:MAG: hypothetical protein R3C04_06735 [Hyphomonas sp.]